MGAALVACAGMTRVSVSVNDAGAVRIGLRGLGLRPEVVVALVVYFLSGLILMSHGRLAVLRARWYNQEVDIAPSLIRRWHASSLLFVLLIALVALLLPLGTTGWLAQALEWVIALMARIVVALVFLFSLLFALLARLLAAIFGDMPQPPPEATPTPTPPPAVPTQAEMVDQLPPWLGGAVLWLVVGVVTLFLLINFARTSGLLEGRLGAQWTRWRLWWRARQARLDEQLAKRIRRLGAPFRRLRRAARAIPPTERPGDLSSLPRDQVRRYYMAAIQEAAEEGAPRSASQTPSEFARDLAENWPESEQDIAGLTDAFLDARYSAQEIGEADATDARGAWRRLVEGFRRPGRDSEDSR